MAVSHSHVELLQNHQGGFTGTAHMAASHSRVELFQNLQGGFRAGALRNGWEMIVWHEECLHATVHVQPNMLVEGISQCQQHGCLWLTALSRCTCHDAVAVHVHWFVCACSGTHADRRHWSMPVTWLSLAHCIVTRQLP